jgi:hypothetical protein
LNCFRNKIPPEQMGSYALDMSQFLSVYCVCRIPGEKRDSVRLADISSLSQHITVVHNNHVRLLLYKFDIIMEIHK